MCAVSAVTDYYRDKWFEQVPSFPVPYYVLPAPSYPSPYFTLKPGVTITVEQWDEYQKLKRVMEEYDARTGQPDCIKPEVAQWEAIAEGAAQ
jgi:hypothetical protein